MSPTHLPPLGLPWNLLNYLRTDRHRDLLLIHTCRVWHM